jgi:hypothetical protein
VETTDFCHMCPQAYSTQKTWSSRKQNTYDREHGRAEYGERVLSGGFLGAVHYRPVAGRVEEIEVRHDRG